MLLKDSLGIHTFITVTLHQLSSHQGPSGYQDLVVVFPGELATEHVSIHLPCSGDFCAIGQGVIKRNAQSEFDVFGAERAGFLDVEVISILLDGDF